MLAGTKRWTRLGLDQAGQLDPKQRPIKKLHGSFNLTHDVTRSQIDCRLSWTPRRSLVLDSCMHGSRLLINVGKDTYMNAQHWDFISMYPLVCVNSVRPGHGAFGSDVALSGLKLLAATLMMRHLMIGRRGVAIAATRNTSSGV